MKDLKLFDLQQKNTSRADDYKAVEQFVDMISDLGFGGGSKQHTGGIFLKRLFDKVRKKINFYFLKTFDTLNDVK